MFSLSTYVRAPKSTLTPLFQVRGNATLRQRPSLPPITETTRNYTVENYKTLYENLTTFTGAESTRKRFWNTVGIAERGSDLTITLDDRPLKTPSGNVLLLPKNKHLVATLIASEWEQAASGCPIKTTCSSYGASIMPACAYVCLYMTKGTRLPLLRGPSMHSQMSQRVPVFVLQCCST
jgi:hypothetical protein